MLHIASTIGAVGFKDQREFDSTLPAFEASGYVPLIKSILDKGWQLSSDKFPSYQKAQIFQGDRFRVPMLRHQIVGEIFYAPNAIHLLLPASASSSFAVTIARGDTNQLHAAFTNEVEKVIRLRLDGRRVRGMRFVWRDQRPALRHRRLQDEPPAKYETPDFDSADLSDLHFLTDASSKDFLRKVSQVGKILSADAAKLVSQGVCTKLLEAALIEKEHLVTCRQDSHTICSLKDAAEIAGGVAANLKCSVCGRTFKDERLLDIYYLSEKGKRLLSGSRWMMIRITELLEREGIERSHIKWNVEQLGEEIDIVVSAFETKVVFELKDRDFGLGDAYPFIFRVNRYGTAVGVIVSTGKIAAEAKQFIEDEVRNRPDGSLKFLFIEGLQHADAAIQELLTELCLRGVKSITEPLTARTGVDLWQFISAKLQTLPAPVAIGTSEPSASVAA